MNFTCSELWKTTYLNALVGVLAMGNVTNPATHAALDAQKAALEADLRQKYARFDRAALRAQPILQAYHAYYKRFKKSYHVQGQLESILWKGKSIPQVAGLVEAMFMAELKNHLLTSGHDLALLKQPVGIDVAVGGEEYVGINGRSQTLKPNDMYIADQESIISSIIYGPDERTRITANTTRALFTVYAPDGVEETAVLHHLQDMRDFVLLFSPDAVVEMMEVKG
ncbi:MAG: hypothetical protein KC419_09155 [Anaerolineales bacterium]|nr:hypothetical protein [Anaerolineales bacterium]MCA9928634.1 hypothetical protein [Anaerolineales bacterium]